MDQAMNPADTTAEQDLSALSQAELEDGLARLCSRYDATEFQLLRYIQECERRGGELSHGMKSTAHWPLAARTLRHRPWGCAGKGPRRPRAVRASSRGGDALPRPDQLRQGACPHPHRH